MSDPMIEGIAVVGMSCRFPGAGSPEEFWGNLRRGVESVRFFSDQELEEAGVDAATIRHPDYVKAKAILEDIERFDAAFFGFNPRVAEITDPQQRIFLECAWEALENAGYDARTYPGAIGVFAGVGPSSYLLANYVAHPEALSAVGALQTLIGNRADHLTTSVAYRLGLKGPAVTVQTTCSTSLVAVHLACQSLLNYQCDMAMAGGVAVDVPQHQGYLFSEGGIASPDGHCRPFDAQAQGIVNGSGAGIVVLKRLSEALAEGDSIHAVIRGSAINNDGSDKVGYTAPSIDGQAQVIAMAQAIAGVRPEEVSYIEAHGTATPMGDPIEVAALKKVFGRRAGKNGFCGLGSVKSNFGHLDTAAGVASLIKTVLALENRELPPSLNFERPNPELGLEQSPFYVNAELAEWPSSGTPRIAGVSSFGIGGTNAHVVLEQAPAPEPSGASRPWQLLLLSARTPGALETATENLRRTLEQNPETELADVAFTLQTGRRPFGYRRAVVCRDADDAVARLASLDPGWVYTSLRQPRERSALFLFPGQGSQHANMGLELYRAEAEFRHQVDRCCGILEPHLGLDLRQVLYPGAEKDVAEAEARLRETSLAQPALFVVEYALARLWMSWGISPAAMMGHSIGEYVAACLAGVFSLEEALALVATRGRLIQELPGGSMLAVHLAEGEARRLLGRDLDLAAINRPSLCVVSGPTDAVSRLRQELVEKEVVSHLLHTSHAFHSRMMEPILEAFTEHMRQVALKPPTLPYVSNVTGTWITAEEATDPGYWARHLRATVRFSAGIETLLRDTDGIYLELGPGTSLRTVVRQHPVRPPGLQVFSSLRHARDREPAMAALLASLGRLWLAGTAVDWSGFYAAERRRRLPLPTYPFERRRYWLDPAKGAALRTSVTGRKPDLADWFYVPTWRRSTPAVVLATPAAVSGQRWVVFTGDTALSTALVRRLEDLSQHVVRVTRGSGFSRLEDGVYTLDPGRRQDYEELFAELRRLGWQSQRILHLWTASPPGQQRGEAELREHLEWGFYSLLFLAQALGKGQDSASDTIRIDVVSSNMQEVVGGELLWPEKAALLGPCRIIPKEYVGLRCHSIDVDLRTGSSGPEELAEQLVAEVLAAPSEPVIAYRGRHRWVPGFDPVHLERAAEVPAGETPSTETSVSGDTRLRSGGCYLITGGLGGMGLTLAEDLARTVRAKLILVGRSALPPREQWQARLKSGGQQDRTARKLRRILELEDLGAEVLALSSDVADERQMSRALDQARKRFGEIHGVIHAAGISPGGIIQLKTPEAAEETLRPKVTGTRVLERLLGEAQLDFFVLCSSRAAFLAPPGSVDYCAANAFLDAFAHGSAPECWGLTASINWCAWQEVGMLAEVASEAAERGAHGATVSANGDEEIDYPLFDRRRVEMDRETYLGAFSVSKRWVLDEHRIAGVPVIPGTTYLEMARAAYEMRGAEAPLEIHDVYFLAPVGVREDEEREVRLEVEPAADGFEFRVTSRTATGNGDGDGWQQNVLGKMRPLATSPARRHDVAEILARCRRGQRIASVEDEQQEDLGPRWHAVQQVYLGEGEVLAILELPEEFAGDFEQLKLHPSLLDRCASLGEMFLVEDKQGAYLPMSYQSLKVTAPLPRKIYSWARLRREDFPSPRRETFSFDVAIMDEQGVVLVDIENFSKKLIHDPGEQLRAPGAVAGLGSADSSPARIAEPEATEPESPGATDKYELTFARGVSPAEGVEVFRRILAHRSPPQVAVSPTDLGAVMREAEAVTALGMEEAAGRETEAPTELHARPDLDIVYQAPETDGEKRLAALWQAMFGIEQIGVHDNFFELGGDSVLGIRIVAKARQMGLEMTPNQLFEHQTIAELAAVIELEAAAEDERPLGTPDGGQQLESGSTAAVAEPTVATGPIPMTPIQHGFFDRAFSHPHHWNITELFEVHGEVKRGVLEAALRSLARHHDGLRLRFVRDGEEWRQVGVSDSDSVQLSSVDLSAIPESRQRPVLEAAAARLQGSLDLSRGPLLRLIFFELGADRADRLLIIGHHLILDVISLEVFIEDLQAAYLQLEQRQAVRFPRRTPSFKAWAQRLARYAESSEVRNESSYWLTLPWSRIGRLPKDYPEGDNTGRSRRKVLLDLSLEESEQILRRLPKVFGVNVQEILLTAMTRALAKWTGRPEQLIGMVGHGRDTFFEDLDVTRTLGWFVVNHPIVLTLDGIDDPAQALHSISQQLRRIPKGGIGYGVLRYLSRDPGIVAEMQALPQSEISLNYKGRYRGQKRSSPRHENTLLRYARENPGPFSHPANRRPSLMHVSGRADDDQLHLAWQYSENQYRRSTIESVAEATRATLRSLISISETRLR